MSQTLNIVLSAAGVVLSLFAVGVIGNTLIFWQGKFRSQLMVVLLGIGFFGMGFLMNVLGRFGAVAELSTFFFFFGITTLAWGVTQIFTYTHAFGNVGSSETL